MTAKTLMIQGTGSHAGKSVLVTALCRAFARQGLRVAPFKAQNMALNSFVTANGREMGWAQAVQAQAAGLLPDVSYNPILLKPSGDQTCQVIVHGKPAGTFSARAYEKLKSTLWPQVVQTFRRLRKDFDLIIIEGAGSPAEINLKKNDIVNMRMARLAQSPVLIVADIDRGGVFASLVGTLQLLTPRERGLVRGLVINKFRGDPKILQPGLVSLRKKTGKPVLGVLPYFDFDYQDQEDSVALVPDASDGPWRADKIRIAVIRLPRISNFTDFDSLRWEPCVDFRFVQNPAALKGADCIILPGSKNTAEDLRWLKKSGMGPAIRRAARTGTTVMGICGGYQMLGHTIRDTGGVESSRKSSHALGLLDIHTDFGPVKSLHQITFVMAAGSPLFAGSRPMRGYEIHMGQTTRASRTYPLFRIANKSGCPVEEYDGATNTSGNVLGTYIHGLMANDAFRHAFLQKIARKKGLRIPPAGLRKDFEGQRKKNWDKLADWAEAHLDMAAVRRIAGIS